MPDNIWYVASIVHEEFSTMLFFCRQSYSDTFLAHFLSFSATPTYHTLPQKVQDGMPIFHIPPNQTKPVQSLSHTPIKLYRTIIYSEGSSCQSVFLR